MEDLERNLLLEAIKERDRIIKSYWKELCYTKDELREYYKITRERGGVNL